MKKYPADFQKDIDKAISLLKDIGCTEIYLFGSLVTGDYHDESDIDIAVKGCPETKFYYAVGKLLTELNHSIDLIDLERDENFSLFLQNSGELARVA